MFSGKWIDRFRIMQAYETDNPETDWTYVSIADMFGISRENVTTTIRNIKSEYPDAINISSAGRTKIIKIDYDAILGDAENETGKNIEVLGVDEGISELTESNILESLNLMDCDVYLRKMDWVAEYQRGGILVAVHEEGQSVAHEKYVCRVDNCIVLSHAKLPSP